MARDKAKEATGRTGGPEHAAETGSKGERGKGITAKGTMGNRRRERPGGKQLEKEAGRERITSKMRRERHSRESAHGRKGENKIPGGQARKVRGPGQEDGSTGDRRQAEPGRDEGGSRRGGAPGG